MDVQSARELFLYTQNDGALYRSRRKPIERNLTDKKAQGKYDSEKAVKLYAYLTEDGAKKYAKEFGAAKDWNIMFPKPVRLQAARMFRDDFEAEHALGNFAHHVPKKYQVKANPFRYDGPLSGGVLDSIRIGDRVTIRTPQGQSVSGKAVMRGPAGWVLNMGGPHGRPGIATEKNVISVKAGKGRKQDHLGNFLASNPRGGQVVVTSPKRTVLTPHGNKFVLTLPDGRKGTVGAADVSRLVKAGVQVVDSLTHKRNPDTPPHLGGPIPDVISGYPTVDVGIGKLETFDGKTISGVLEGVSQRRIKGGYTSNVSIAYRFTTPYGVTYHGRGPGVGMGLTLRRSKKRTR